MVRATVGILITTIVSNGKLDTWPELIPRLINCLKSNNDNLCEGALGVLQKICEDSSDQLENPVLGLPVKELLPEFFRFFLHKNPKFRYFIFILICEILA